MKFSNLIFSLLFIFLIVAVSPAQSQCPPAYIFTGEFHDFFGSSVASAGDVNNDGFDDLIVGAPHAGSGNFGEAYVYSGLNGDTIYVFTGEAMSDRFGGTVASAGDVDNDGFDDLIVGASLNDAGGNNAGRAYVFSGQTGDTLYVFTGEADSDRFGISVGTAGDVNNDGFDDLIVGADWNDAGGPEAGRAYVFSGQTGDTLHIFTGEAAFDRFGSPVASAGDVNNDGYDDLIVGALVSDTGDSSTGRAYVFSGQTGDTIYVFTGEAAEDRFGQKVASAGDVDNDGFDDLIVGAIFNNAGGSGAGRAYVFSGQSGDTIHVFTGEAERDAFGNSVASAGDVDNDGFDDLIVGASHNGAVAFYSGRAYVFSGKTGDTIYVFTGVDKGDQFGFSVASAGDVNNDGFDDLIVGEPYNDSGGVWAGRAYVFSGQTGDTIHVFTGEAARDNFGNSVASAGDVDNDGFDDLIVGASHNGAAGTWAGRAYVFSGQSGDTIHVFTGEGEFDAFGHSVSSAGDVDNDGFDDLIVGAPFIERLSEGDSSIDISANGVGRAYVFSGQSGDTIYVFTSDTTGDLFGHSVASGGDVNSDGFDDLIVGAIRNDAGGTNAGRAYVFSGKGECICADANGDSLVNVDDVDFLVDFYFYGGATPFLYFASDMNCDGSVDIADITYLAAYLNGTGAPPCCQ